MQKTQTCASGTVDSTVFVLRLSQEKKYDILEEKRRNTWGPKCKHKLSKENDGGLLP